MIILRSGTWNSRITSGINATVLLQRTKFDMAFLCLWPLKMVSQQLLTQGGVFCRVSPSFCPVWGSSRVSVFLWPKCTKCYPALVLHYPCPPTYPDTTWTSLTKTLQITAIISSQHIKTLQITAIISSQQPVPTYHVTGFAVQQIPLYGQHFYSNMSSAVDSEGAWYLLIGGF